MCKSANQEFWGTLKFQGENNSSTKAETGEEVAVRWRNHTPAWLLLMHFDIKHSTGISLLSLAFWTKQSRQRVVRKSHLVSSSCRMLDCHARGWGFKP